MREGEIILWTSIVGLRNIKSNRCFFAYNEKDEINILQISIPLSAIHYHDKVYLGEMERIQFGCHEQSKW